MFEYPLGCRALLSVPNLAISIALKNTSAGDIEASAEAIDIAAVAAPESIGHLGTQSCARLTKSEK